MSEVKTIGHIRYQFLKGLPKEALSSEDVKSIEKFESENHCPEPTEEMKAYFEKVRSMPEEVKVLIDPRNLAKSFLKKWDEVIGKNLVLTDDMKHNLRTLNFYMANDQRFEKGCEVDLSEPGLQKGLLIIGPFGNGKTSAMKVYQRLLMCVPGYSFNQFTSTHVVDMWENCKEPSDKQSFWKTMTTGVCHFDDLLREREASNYGKVEIFRDILLKRYDAGVKTYITCNSPTANEADALERIAEKYGEIVHDRVYEMFNIIFWKGKSFRR